MARSISARAISGFVRAVRHSAGTPARSNQDRLLVQLSGRNNRNASTTGTSPRASVSDTRVWQFAERLHPLYQPPPDQLVSSGGVGDGEHPASPIAQHPPKNRLAVSAATPVRSVFFILTIAPLTDRLFLRQIQQRLYL